MWINAFSWWIEKLVKDKTFVDVGGVWNTTNEKVTEASLAGASEVTMIDAMKDKSHWWDKFDKRWTNVPTSNGRRRFLQRGRDPFWGRSVTKRKTEVTKRNKEEQRGTRKGIWERDRTNEGR